MKRGFLKNGLSGPSTRTSAPPIPNNIQTAAAQTKGDLRGAKTTDASSANPSLQSIELESASVAESEGFSHRQGMKTAQLEGKLRETILFGFGRSDEVPTCVDTLVITWSENRLRLREHPGFKQALVPALATSNATVVEVSPVPGKGLALIAKRDIPAGHLIIRERPLLVMYAAIPADVAMNWDKLLQHMTKERRAAYDGLYNCKPRGPHMVDSLSIARTNALGFLGPFGEDRHLCVCELVSRANHDCTPNAHFAFNQENFCGELTSVMPISAGSEITIGYTLVMAPVAERKAELKQKWGFICTCPACDESSPSFEARELRRGILKDRLQLEKIKQINETQLGGWTGYEDSHIEHILGIVDAERLFIGRPGALADFADMEAYFASANGDYTRVVQLCRRGLDELRKLGICKSDETGFKMDGLLAKAEKAKNAAKLQRSW